MFIAVDRVVGKPHHERNRAVYSDPDKSVGLMFCPVDFDTSKSFAKNYGNHVRSDIALLNSVEDERVAAELVSRLSERQANYSDMPVSDLFLSAKSKYCQTPAEMVDYYEHVLEIRDNRELDRLEGEEKEKRAAELKAERQRLRESMNQVERDEYLVKRRQKELGKLLED